MPKSQRTNNPARKIRTAIGFTQAEMAERLRVAKSAIEKLEYGSMKMSRELADRYHKLTGCDIRFGEEGEGEIEIVATFQGEDYTRASFEQHQSQLEKHGGHHDEDITWAMLNLELLLEAAFKEGCLREVLDSFEQFRAKTEEDLELVDAVDSLINRGEGSVLGFSTRVRITPELKASPRLDPLQS